MSALPLLVEFSAKGIKVRVERSEIALTAPKGAITPTLVSRVKNEKPALLVFLRTIRRKAGDDWEQIAKDPMQLKAFASLFVISEMRKRGIVPDHYSATTVCRHCGPVPIFDGLPDEVTSCPWCFNRIKGLPLPIDLAK